MAHVVASQGVWQGELNELVATGAVSPVSINTGRALVDGVWYESDAAETVAIPTPGANPRVDRIVLRKDWALQTVRITRIAGAESAAQVPPAPALVQIDGITWDLPLWQTHITTGGVITLWHDEREFIGQYVPADFISDTVVLLDDDFFGEPWVDAEKRGPWFATIDTSCNISALADANFGSGGFSFGHDGLAINQAAILVFRNVRPELLNIHLRVRAREPNSDADLDRSMGLSGSLNTITPSDAIFFRSDGAGNWFAVTSSGGVPTAQDTGVALSNDWKIFEVKMQGSSVVTFLIDGVIVAVSTTNIPTGVNLLGHIQILDNGSAPAANQYQDVDYMKVRGDR